MTSDNARCASAPDALAISFRTDVLARGHDERRVLRQTCRCFVQYLLAWFLWSIAAQALGQTPHALVVGNNAYQYVSPLRNAVRDAISVAQELMAKGFTVTQIHDATALQMRGALTDFVNRIGTGGQGIVFYAGHGVQLGGENFLIPVDLKTGAEQELRTNALSLQTVLDAIGKTSPKAVALILDACRDNPFEASRKSESRGLGEAGQSIPDGVLVSYSASAGQAAVDALSPADPNPNGVFIRHFIQFAKDPALEIRQVLRRTRGLVMQEALGINHRQIPSMYDALPKEVNLLRSSPFRSPDVRPASLPSSIRLIVPAAPGGPTDFVARALAARLKELEISIQIENIVDIAGQRTADLVAQAPPNGTVLLLSPYPASLRRELENDQRLRPIGLVAETPMMLVARHGSEVRDMKSLMALNRNREQPWKVGVSGPGSSSEACLGPVRNLFGRERVEPVVFSFPAAAAVAMTDGKVDLMCEVSNIVNRWIPGRIAQYVANLQEDATADRGPPTAQAQGYAVVAPNWLAVFGPSGTSDAIVAGISWAVQKVLADERFRTALHKDGVNSAPVEKGIPEEVRLSLQLGAVVGKGPGGAAR